MFAKRISQVTFSVIIVTIAAVAVIVTGGYAAQAYQPASGDESVVAMSPPAPTFVYETILNLAQFDAGRDIAVDAAGNAYVVARAHDNGNDVVIVKLNPKGILLWRTYLRGNNHDFGLGIALDAAGNAYVSGWTLSTDFPVLNAWQSTLNGHADGFITTLSGQDGSLIYSSYFGGSRADYAQDIALDEAGNVYITGYTDSTDLPTINPIQGDLNLTSCFCDDAFVAKFNGAGTALLYGTYLGGSLDDRGAEIDVDDMGNITFAGTTRSPDFPLVSAFQSAYSGNQDAFATQISSDGATLNYSTYLGGSKEEYVLDIALGDDGVYLTGRTNSINFPTTPEAFQEQHRGGTCGSPPFTRSCDDVFVTQLLSDGSAAFSTFVGGDLDDIATGIALNSEGDIQLIGYTHSSDFPMSDYAGISGYIFLSELNIDGSQLNGTLPITSAVPNDGHGITIDRADAIYITGGQNAPADLYIAKLTAAPASNLLRSTDIQLQYRSYGFWNVFQGRIMVEDASGTAVANATVMITWTFPNGETLEQHVMTHADGIAISTIKGARGTYTLSIDDILLAGYTFDPANSVLEKSITTK